MGILHHAKPSFKMKKRSDTVYGCGIEAVSGAQNVPTGKIQLLTPKCRNWDKFGSFLLFYSIFDILQGTMIVNLSGRWDFGSLFDKFFQILTIGLTKKLPMGPLSGQVYAINFLQLFNEESQKWMTKNASFAKSTEKCRAIFTIF